MKHLIIVQILFINCLMAFAHNVTLTDSIKHTPISHATIYDVDGKMIGRSDMNGNIDLTKGQTYHVSHIGYESKKIVCDDGNTIYLSPASYEIPEVSITARKKKFYHCKVYFRSIEHVDSTLKYYYDGIREFFIDTKTKKIKSNNFVDYYFKLKRQEIAQKKRNFMIMDRYVSLPYIEKNSLYEEIINDKRQRIEGHIVYGDSTQIGMYEISPDKNEIILSSDLLYPKSTYVGHLFGYTQVLSKHNLTEFYKLTDSAAPTIFDLKSSSRYRHFTLSHKKEGYVRDIDVEDIFYVVESEYTDTNKTSSHERLKEDYEKYSAMYLLDSRIREQLTIEQQQQ